MSRLLWTILLLSALVRAQSSPAPSTANEANARTAAANDDLFPTPKPSGKVSLARGVLRQIDPIHDQMILRTFGGGDIRIGFNVQTKLVSDNATSQLTSVPPGTVVSVDTAVENGRLFALSVRTGRSNAAELDGQVVRYDPTRSQLTLRDSISPQNVSLHVTAATKVVNRGHSVSAQTLASGMLVRVWFSAIGNTANQVEILAERGNSFVFEGKILSVDLRSRVLSLWNDTDQSLRELSFGALDATTIARLREGANVSIQTEFDGEHYDIQSVTPVASPRAP